MHSDGPQRPRRAADAADGGRELPDGVGAPGRGGREQDLLQRHLADPGDVRRGGGADGDRDGDHARVRRVFDLCRPAPPHAHRRLYDAGRSVSPDEPRRNGEHRVSFPADVLRDHHALLEQRHSEWNLRLHGVAVGVHCDGKSDQGGHGMLQGHAATFCLECLF